MVTNSLRPLDAQGSRLRRWLIALGGLVLLAALALVGCGSGAESPAAPKACVPGSQITCACLGGGQGMQVCKSDGSSLGACQGCPAATDADVVSPDVETTQGQGDAPNPSDTDAAQDQDAPSLDPCSDGVVNGSETDIDCGGSQCKPCTPGKKCATKADCSNGVCQDGKCPVPDCNAAEPCDDKNPCTTDTCSSASDCTHAPASNVPCDDGIACTVGDVCANGKCVYETSLCDCLTDNECTAKYGSDTLCSGSYSCTAQNTCVKKPPPSCDTSADTACIVTKCDEATGKCAPTPIQKYPVACDDGNACTMGDVCEHTDQGQFTGKCLGGTNVCGCTKNSDCAAKEDGNLCNGTLYCNPKTNSCELNPTTVVVCPTATDTACLKHVCNKYTGLCETIPSEYLSKNCPKSDPSCDVWVKIPAGMPPLLVPCDDGNPCSLSAACMNGQCSASASKCECQVNADCAQTGDKCSGTYVCDKASGKCVVDPSTVPLCSSAADTACAKNTCNPATGTCVMKPTATGAAYVPCEDGSACTMFDQCDADGKCASGANTCQCQTNADCAALDDGDACNGTLYCNVASGKCEIAAATVVVCSPAFDTPCTKNTCQPITGQCQLVQKNDYLVCDDGNDCTTGDHCLEGACLSGDNKCACATDADCTASQSLSLCDGTLYCDLSVPLHQCKIKPGSVVVCPANSPSPCLVNACDPAKGTCALLPTPEWFAKCEDGNPCTLADYCKDGACQSGGNVCSCASDGDCAKFNNGNPCTGKLVCTGTASKSCTVDPATVVVCSGGSECNQNVCDSKTGKCASVVVPSACDDGNPCTIDACSAGKCSHVAIDDPKAPCSVGDASKVCLKGLCQKP